MSFVLLGGYLYAYTFCTELLRAPKDVVRLRKVRLLPWSSLLIPNPLGRA